jgi:hypothetical protein
MHATQIGVYYEMWKQQIREELGETSTVEGTVSDDSDSNNGKDSKQKSKDIGKPAAATIELPASKSTDTAATATAAGVQEALLSPAIEPAVVEPTELTQVIVEPTPTTPATPAAISAIIDEVASSTGTGGEEDSVPTSQPSSGRSTPKPKKKKKNKKKN